MEMTTEHVSVPRELAIRLRDELGRMIAASEDSDTMAIVAMSDLIEILSRATPSNELSNRITVLEDDCDQLMKERDAAEAAISDMFEKVTGRSAEWSNLWGYAEAVEEAEEHVAQLEDKIKPTAPRVVTDADVERALKAFTNAPGIAKDSEGVFAMRAALESFATSLPAARVPTLTREQVVKLLSLACEEMDVINHHLQKMLAAAPQSEKKG